MLLVFQFLASAVLVLTTHVHAHSALTLGLSVGGMLLHLWAIRALKLHRLTPRFVVRTGTGLVTNGPYRWVRHPMYTALAVFTLGFVTTPFRWWKPIVWFSLLLVLHRKALLEEAALRSCCESYDRYKKTTRRFVPFVY